MTPVLCVLGHCPVSVFFSLHYICGSCVFWVTVLYQSSLSITSVLCVVGHCLVSVFFSLHDLCTVCCGSLFCISLLPPSPLPPPPHYLCTVCSGSLSCISLLPPLHLWWSERKASTPEATNPGIESRFPPRGLLRVDSYPSLNTRSEPLTKYFVTENSFNNFNAKYFI